MADAITLSLDWGTIRMGDNDCDDPLIGCVCGGPARVHDTITGAARCSEACCHGEGVPLDGYCDDLGTLAWLEESGQPDHDHDRPPHRIIHGPRSCDCDGDAPIRATRPETCTCEIRDYMPDAPLFCCDCGGRNTTREEAARG